MVLENRMRRQKLNNQAPECFSKLYFPANAVSLFLLFIVIARSPIPHSELNLLPLKLQNKVLVNMLKEKNDLRPSS